jgi:peptide chain release factor 1
MDASQRARLDEMAAEHSRLLDELASPEVASDHQRSAEIGRRVAELGDPVRLYQEWTAADAEAAEAKELLKDASAGEDEEFLRATLAEAEAKAAAAEEKLGELLRPRDPRDDRPVIVEIRAGAGGDEAALFAGELMRMYQRFSEREGWKTEMLDMSEGSVGGVKEVVFEVKNKGAFSKLRYESGVHRVQRVPSTESSGRIHTSTVTVAVLPEADEVDVDVDPSDLEIERYRAQGAGGQHVNTTDSAVRITHRPTGIVATSQSERSQHQNKDRAMRVLLARVKALFEAQAHSEQAAERRSQVGTGDRSEKIRTYNFPQNRVTDHRINFTTHGIQQVMDGDMRDLVEALRQADHGDGEG